MVHVLSSLGPQFEVTGESELKCEWVWVRGEGCYELDSITETISTGRRAGTKPWKHAPLHRISCWFLVSRQSPPMTYDAV